MFVELHVIQNHSPSNLNRDDTGSPKDATFGGFRRARISSQCIKRSIRRSHIFRQELEEHLGMRTRRLPELVRSALKEQGFADDIAEVAAKKASGFGTAEGKERPVSEDGTYATAQTMFLTDHDVNAVVEVMKKAAQEKGSAEALNKVPAKELQALSDLKGYRPITVDIALFGRMITSEAFRDADASCQVAHAISTHKVAQEFDYFTAVDDLKDLDETEDDAGADMIGDVEFNSACYYKYFSIDFDGLVANLTGESAHRKDITDGDRNEARELAARTVQTFLKSAVLTTPTGKQNTFAAHQLPAMVFVEVRPCKIPVNYANAFVEPAKATAKTDLVSDSLDKFARHMAAMSKCFNLQADLRLILVPEHPELVLDGVSAERVQDLESFCARLRSVMLDG